MDDIKRIALPALVAFCLLAGISCNTTGNEVTGANVASPKGSIESRSHKTQSTSQPATTNAKATQTAGRDTTQTSNTVNVSGSAWPIVAVVAVIAAGFCCVLYLRAKIHEVRDVGNARRRESKAGMAVQRAYDEARVMEDNAAAVAEAISAYPAGEVRDVILALIRSELPDKAAWNRFLGARGLRVKRSTKLEHPESAGKT